MRVLVTGSHGFLGSAFVAFLEKKQVPSLVYDRMGPLPSLDFDSVVHCAGYTPYSRVAGDVVSAADYYAANVESTARLLGLLRLHKNIKTLVSIGSAAEYGSADHPFVEGDEEHPVSDYGRSKCAQTALIKEFAEESGVQTFNLRLFNIIGVSPTARLLPQRKNISFVEQLVRQFRAASTDTVHITADNEHNVRDYIDESDFLEALFAALYCESVHGYELVNISSGVGTTLGELTALFGACTNKLYMIENTQPNVINSSIGNNSKAQQMLGWRPHISLKQSVWALCI